MARSSSAVVPCEGTDFVAADRVVVEDRVGVVEEQARADADAVHEAALEDRIGREFRQRPQPRLAVGERQLPQSRE